MKKLFALAALFLAGQAVAQTRIETTAKDGTVSTHESTSLTISEENHTVQIGPEEPQSVTDLRSLRFTRDGLPWNLQWKLCDGSRAERFGYGSIMHIRDLMTADIYRPDNGYNWFGTWQKNQFLGKNYVYAQGVWRTMRTLAVEANDWIRTLKENGQENDGWLGVAYTCRALTYLDMARMYEFLPNDRTNGISESGQDITGLTVPLIDETTEYDPVTRFYNVPRATKNEAAAFIQNDLDRAEQLITKLNEPSRLVPHIDVVYGLKARLYLWTGDYAKAREYARRAIETTSTHIMTRAEMTDKTTGFNTAENWMWGVQHFPTDPTVTSGITNWTSWMSNEYNEGYAAAGAELLIDKSLYDRMTDTDVRKQLFVPPYESWLESEAMYMLIDMDNNMLSPYASIKFRPNHGVVNGNEGLLTAFPLMRVEEMYLIEAEAAAHTSPAEGAALLTTFVRQNRDEAYDFRATTEEEAVSEIILQKRLELWGEGQVYFDIKRLNMSVTRDYDGTNCPEGFRFNTESRPAWMNFVFVRTEEQQNLGLAERNNPDPSYAYLAGYQPAISDDEARAAITKGIVLHEPRFKADVPYVPLNAVGYFLFHYDEAEHTEAVSIEYTPQLSMSPDFPLGQTVPVSFPLNSQQVLTSAKYLLHQAGMPDSGKATAYLRVRGKVEQATSFTTCSNVVSFGIDIPQELDASQTFDYLPEAAISMAGPIDEEKYVGLDSVKICDVRLKGEGEIRHFYENYYSNGTYNPISMMVYYPEEFRFQGSYSMDKNGVAENYQGETMTQAASILRHMQMDFQPRVEATARCSYIVQRNDLAQTRHTEIFDVTILPNRQLYTEMEYSWKAEIQSTMHSTLDDARFSGPVSYQKAEGASVYRILSPYAQGRNLLFDVDAENQVSVDSQYAYTAEDGQPVRVSGSGLYEKGMFDMQLTFTKDDGTQLGTFRETIGEKTDWISLGKATITDDCFTSLWSLENVSWKVNIEESSTTPGLYRLTNPYNTLDFRYNETGDIDPSQVYYMYIHAEDPTAVYFEQTPLGVNWGYGMISLWSRADYHISNGSSVEDVKNAGWFGTLTNGTITFPAGGIVISMSEYNNGGFYLANRNGLFSIVLPNAQSNAPAKAGNTARPRGIAPLDKKTALKQADSMQEMLLP